MSVQCLNRQGSTGIMKCIMYTTRCAFCPSQTHVLMSSYFCKTCLLIAHSHLLHHLCVVKHLTHPEAPVRMAARQHFKLLLHLQTPDQPTTCKRIQYDAKCKSESTSKLVSVVSKFCCCVCMQPPDQQPTVRLEAFDIRKHALMGCHAAPAAPAAASPAAAA
jgi:hypothetical protein